MADIATTYCLHYNNWALANTPNTYKSTFVKRPVNQYNYKILNAKCLKAEKCSELANLGFAMPFVWKECENWIKLKFCEKNCHHHHWSLEHILFQDLFVQNAVNNLNNADADSADADVVCLVGLLMILPRLLHHLNFNVSFWHAADAKYFWSGFVQKTSTSWIIYRQILARDNFFNVRK